MLESFMHIKLLDSLKDWIYENYKKDEVEFIWIDTSLNGTKQKPQKINSFIPDIYAKCLNTHKELIGEAKTSKDLETKHTEEQIIAFLEYCSSIKKSCFILAVPWDMVRFAGSLIKNLKKELNSENIETVIINEC